MDLSYPKHNPDLQRFGTNSVEQIRKSLANELQPERHTFYSKYSTYCASPENKADLSRRGTVYNPYANSGRNNEGKILYSISKFIVKMRIFAIRKLLTYLSVYS